MCVKFVVQVVIVVKQGAEKGPRYCYMLGVHNCNIAVTRNGEGQCWSIDTA